MNKIANDQSDFIQQFLDILEKHQLAFCVIEGLAVNAYAEPQEFINRASCKTVLGYEIPVASMEDVLQGKLWAFSDTTRRPSKRQNDLLDIMRLVEAYPQLISQLPSSLKERLTDQDRG